MSNIRIGSISGGTNNIGDHATINNHPAADWPAPASPSAPQPSQAAPGPAPGSPAGHAFISSDPEDAPQADQIQHALHNAGISVWRDDRNLLPGQDRNTAIRQAITTGTLAFIACFSRTSISRNRSHQRQELTLAIGEFRLRDPDRPWLIPVRLDDCVIPDLDIGSGRTLTALHSIDLFGPHATSNRAQLITAIQATLNQPPPR